VCSPNNLVKSAEPLNPLNKFCSNLKKDGVFTESQQPYHQSTSPPIGQGSFFFVRIGSPNTVQKTAKVGSNNSKKGLGTSQSMKLMTKTHVLDLLNAIRKSHGNPHVVKTFEMYFSHTSENNGVLTLVQEKCFPLPKNMSGLLGLIQCVIALYRAGLPVSDVKPANFMVRDDGSVVCVDIDLREPKKGVYKLVASGEYAHTIGLDVSEQFQQLLLVFVEIVDQPIVGDRKDIFLKIYQPTGILKSLGLLSLDKSVSKTTIEDFAEVLRNIGLSDEDIAYLIGLLTPPPSSQ
jgi:hypothetical protein